ncbi:MAG: metallophosphoesterase [Eubacterium sp.]|nr:metallophosphoesterase [Eubacterium sp.]
MSIYVCGDIHGQYKLYKEMLDDIGFGPGDHLFIIGDMIDRGPDGIKILQDAMYRSNVACLIGNHELMMYDSITGTGETGEFWAMWNNGGGVTRDVYNRLPSKARRDILAYLENLYLQTELKLGEQTWLLSHSSFLKDMGTIRWKDVSYRDVNKTVWDSPWRSFEHVPAEKYREDGRYHIIGHVPVQRIYAAKQREQEFFGQTTESAIDKITPAVPTAYIDEENHLINIDLGCAAYDPGKTTKRAGLCCMNLSAYAEGEAAKAFTYYM